MYKKHSENHSQNDLQSKWFSDKYAYVEANRAWKIIKCTKKLRTSIYKLGRERTNIFAAKLDGCEELPDDDPLGVIGHVAANDVTAESAIFVIERHLRQKLREDRVRDGTTRGSGSKGPADF